MPAAIQGADGPEEVYTVARALLLLKEALEIVDQLGERPEVGARLQGVIDSLEDDSVR